jgi:hypothetical protein
MVTEDIPIKTLRPILDSVTGVVLVPEGTIGNLLDWNITPGPRSFIPTTNLFDSQLKRRLQFSVSFPQGVYQLLFPEQLIFLNPWGLLKALLSMETIQRVEPISPTPRFRSSIASPHAVTLILANGLRVCLIVDKVSGFLDLELEAEEC